MLKKAVIIISVILLSVLTGCGEKEKLKSITYDSVDAVADENTDIVEGECPEGYVYDYQVSMEPIPEEIAALGGDVCGTIHAYPTEIKIALAKQKIENDEELKKQNEKNITAIKDYLSEQYEGEFEVEPFNAEYEYMCTEEETEKKFKIFISPLFVEDKTKKVVLNDQYYYSENAEKYLSDIEKVLSKEIANEFVYDVFYESGESLIDGKLNVYIAIFTDEAVEYLDEQNQILQIYSVMKNLQESSDEEFSLKLVITYFLKEYQEIIEMQYQAEGREYIYINGKKVDKLISNDEVLEQFAYSEDEAWNTEYSLDNILKNQEEFEEAEYILEYWRQR